MIAIKGIIPVMVTPFDNGEEVDEEKLRSSVNFLIGQGIHGLFPVGTTGEFFSLTASEKQRILDVVVDETRGRVPVFAGPGAISTGETVVLMRTAECCGADAAIVMSPFFITPSQDELYAHYCEVAEATNLPILLYNNPGRTGVNLSADLVERLAAHPNILGIKESSGDLALTLDIIRKAGPDFHVLMGHDGLILAGLIHGASGAVTATANVVPQLVLSIYAAFINGDMELARKAQEQLLPLRLAFSLGSYPAAIKEALRMVGQDYGPARRPLQPLQPAQRKILQSIIDQLRGSETSL